MNQESRDNEFLIKIILKYRVNFTSHFVVFFFLEICFPICKGDGRMAEKKF